MTDKAKGNIALLLTAIMWGSGFIAQKLGNDAMPPLAFNAIRQIVAAIVLLPILALSLKKNGYLNREKLSSEEYSYRKKKSVRTCITCGFFLMLATMAQQVGMLTVSVGKSGFISAMYIVFTPLLSVVVGRKVKSKAFVCTVIALFGFAVMSLNGGLGAATTGDWLTLASAVLYAAQIVAVDAFIDEGNAILIAVMQGAFSGVLGLVISLIAESTTYAQLMAGVPAILYSAVVSVAGGYTLQIVGQKYTDSTTAALIMSLEAVFAVIFGAIILGEMMSVRELLGCAIILAATIFDQVDIKRV